MTIEETPMTGNAAEQQQDEPQSATAPKKAKLNVLDGGAIRYIAPVEKGSIEELYFNKPVRIHVREFGAVMGIVAMIVAGSKGWHNAAASITFSWAAVGVCFYFFCSFFPKAARPLWSGWMKLAHYLGLVMTTVITSLLWVCLFIPTSLVLRVLGKRVMDLRYKADVESYWEDRKPEKHDFKLLEKQF